MVAKEGGGRTNRQRELVGEERGGEGAVYILKATLGAQIFLADGPTAIGTKPAPFRRQPTNFADIGANGFHRQPTNLVPHAGDFTTRGRTHK